MNSRYFSFFAATVLSIATVALADAKHATRGVTMDAGEVQMTRRDIAETEIRKRAAALAGQFKLDADKSSDWLEIRPNGANMLLLNFSAPEGVAVDAEQFMNALTDGIGPIISKAYAQASEEALREVMKDQKDRETRVSAATQRAAELKARVRDLAVLVNTSDDSIRAAAAKLEDEEQKLDLDLRAKTARREAMEAEIAKQSELIDRKSSNDPIVLELQKVVDAREQVLATKKQMNGVGQATPADVADAVAAAAEARAKLLQRKHDASVEAGGDVIQAFNRELLNLSIDLHELNARKEFLDTRLDRLREAAKSLEAMHEAESEAFNEQNESGRGFFGGGNQIPGKVRVTIQKPSAN